VFLQEHFHVQSCTYKWYGEHAGLAGHVRKLQDCVDQGLNLSLAGCGIHAGELQAWMIADAGVADHGSSGVKELLPDPSTQLI